MNRKEQAELAFLETFRQRSQTEQPQMHALDIIQVAREVPVPLTRGQKIGSALFGLLGKEYKPSYSGRLYPTLARLEQRGEITSEWDDPYGVIPHRRSYQLAAPNSTQE